MKENKHKRMSKFETVKFENVYHYKMYFRIYYNMKFILPFPKTA